MLYLTFFRLCRKYLDTLHLTYLGGEAHPDQKIPRFRKNHRFCGSHCRRRRMQASTKHDRSYATGAKSAVGQQSVLMPLLLSGFRIRTQACMRTVFSRTMPKMTPTKIRLRWLFPQKLICTSVVLAPAPGLAICGVSPALLGASAPSRFFPNVASLATTSMRPSFCLLRGAGARC